MANLTKIADTASRLPMALPHCSVGHGQMVLAPSHTREQAFCGTWYRCPRCHSGVLFTSPELRAQLAA